jgi:hypothetical protein
MAPRVEMVWIEWRVVSRWRRRQRVVAHATIAGGGVVSSPGQVVRLERWNVIHQASAELEELCQLRDCLRVAGIPVQNLAELQACRGPKAAQR